MSAKAILLALLLIAAPLLAGCMSDEEPPAARERGDPAAPDEPPVDAGSPLDDTGSGGADDPGSRAHKHDYWGGKTEVVLVEGTYPLDGFCASSSSEFALHAGCATLRMGNGTVVYQGANRLTLTPTWSDPKITGLSLTYRDAAAIRPEPIPLESGVAVELPVDQARADVPHSKKSEWEFRLAATSTAGHGYAWGVPVTVVITIYRGLDLPLDPPHPDFWGETNERTIGPINGTLKKAEFDYVTLDHKQDTVRIPAPAIVPPGTTQMIVEYTYTVKDPADNVEYDLTPQWKSAYNDYWTYVRDDEDAAGWGRFVLDVTPEMVDSPYSNESAWAFAFSQYHSVGGVAPGVGTVTAAAFEREIDYSLQIILLRDARTAAAEEE